MLHSFQRRPVFIVLALLFFILLGCAGKQIVSTTSTRYFIPKNQRLLYVNETVNLTSDGRMGHDLTTIVTRYYKQPKDNQHKVMSFASYPDAKLILTLYLKEYNVTRFARTDAFGHPQLKCILSLELSLVQKKGIQKSTIGERAKSFTYLRRVPISITAHSRELPQGSSTLEALERILFIKLTGVLDEYFRTGRLIKTS